MRAPLPLTQPSQAPTPSVQASLPLTQPSQAPTPSVQASLPSLLPLTQPSQAPTPSVHASLLLTQPSQSSQETMPARTQPTQFATPAMSLPLTQSSQLELGITGASDVN
ncbi:hypothetical protein PR002_g27056, partial [Phytophthora rubi]